MNLYEITKEIEEIACMVDEDGVLLPEAELWLDQLNIERKIKLENIWKYIKNLEYFEEALKSEKQKIDTKRKTIENKIERLKWYIHWNMKIFNEEKVQCWTVSFSLRESSSIIVDDIDKLDEKYIKITKEPMKQAIKDDLKLWIEVQNISILKSKNLQIK